MSSVHLNEAVDVQLIIRKNGMLLACASSLISTCFFFLSLSLFLIGGVVVVVAAVVDGTIVDVAEWTAAMAWRI